MLICESLALTCICSNAHELIGIFFHRLSKGYEKLHFPQMIVSASSYVIDLTKDVLMVIQISLAQGGLKKILKHPQPYMAGVSNK